MGIWIDILTLGATGQSPVARQKLALDLPLVLRSFVASSRGSREYVGELPRAVTRFRYSLSDESERALLEALEREFVDAVVDDVINGVEKSLLLVELCLAKAKKNKGLSDNEREFPMSSLLSESPYDDVSSVYLEEPRCVHVDGQHARHLAPEHARCHSKPGPAAGPGLCRRLQTLGPSSL